MNEVAWTALQRRNRPGAIDRQHQGMLTRYSAPAAVFQTRKVQSAVPDVIHGGSRGSPEQPCQRWEIILSRAHHMDLVVLATVGG